MYRLITASCVLALGLSLPILAVQAPAQPHDSAQGRQAGKIRVTDEVRKVERARRLSDGSS